jgi:hypothetical protein
MYLDTELIWCHAAQSILDLYYLFAFSIKVALGIASGTAVHLQVHGPSGISM